MRIYKATNEDTGEVRDIKIRALTRKDIKALKPYGYSYFGYTIDSTLEGNAAIEHGEEAIEKGLCCAVSPEDVAFLEDCPNRETKAAWFELIKETYGSKEEEKNSETTSDGGQTESV